MGFTAVARVTFIVDKKGIVRQVQIYSPVKIFHVLNFSFSLCMDDRDALDATLNYGAHAKFVENWLDKLYLENEIATATATAESPAAS
jgi:peroxiredoxin Q/BCP